MNGEVIDLTVQKHRQLPSSILQEPIQNRTAIQYPPAIPLKANVNLMTYNSFPNTNVLTNVPSARVLPSYYEGGLNKAVNSYKPQTQYTPNAKIIFSMVSSNQFAARAEEGKISGDVISAMKMVPGVKFDWQTCKWLFPLSAHDILQVALARFGHFVEAIPRNIIAAAQLKNRRDQQLNSVSENGACKSEESLLALKGSIPDSVLHSLAPFQRDAVQFVLQNKGRALVADEMGLGKTRTAISVAMAYRDDWPVMIVSPSSARHHWQSELLSLLYPDCIATKDITIVENMNHPLGKSSSTVSFKNKILIISYNLISKLAENLEKINFNVIIVDESHYMKNAAAARTKCLLPLLHRSKRVILLSGTPALSRPIELFTQLHAIAPMQWNNLKEYGRRYCVTPKTKNNANNKVWPGSKTWSEFSGANNTQELHIMLTATLMIRRLKKDILTQLPLKKRFVIKVDTLQGEQRDARRHMLDVIGRYEDKMIQAKRRKEATAKVTAANRNKRKLAAAVRDDYDDNVDTDDDAEAEAELTELKKEKKLMLMALFTQSGEAKLPAVIKHLEKFLENKLTGKVLVFCHHRAVMDGLVRTMSRLNEDYIRIDGQTNSKDRHSRVQHFQTSPNCRVALLAITAAGIALTLTAASTVYFVELYWTPGSLLQAEDRAHRIGQSNTVRVTYFLADDTVDELLWPLVRAKMKLLGEIVEGHSQSDFTIGCCSSSNNNSNNNSNSSSSDNLIDSKTIATTTTSATAALDDETGNIIDDDLNGLVKELAWDAKQQQLQQQQNSGRSNSSNKVATNYGMKKSSSSNSRLYSINSDDDDDDEDEGSGNGGSVLDINQNNDNGDDDDDDAVQVMEEPDQLALLYMAMQTYEKSTTNNITATATTSSLRNYYNNNHNINGSSASNKCDPETTTTTTNSGAVGFTNLSCLYNSNLNSTSLINNRCKNDNSSKYNGNDSNSSGYHYDVDNDIFDYSRSSDSAATTTTTTSTDKSSYLYYLSRSTIVTHDRDDDCNNNEDNNNKDDEVEKKVKVMSSALTALNNNYSNSIDLSIDDNDSDIPLHSIATTSSLRESSSSSSLLRIAHTKPTGPGKNKYVPKTTLANKTTQLTSSSSLTQINNNNNNGNIIIDNNKNSISNKEVVVLLSDDEEDEASVTAGFVDRQQQKMIVRPNISEIDDISQNSGSIITEREHQIKAYAAQLNYAVDAANFDSTVKNNNNCLSNNQIQDNNNNKEEEDYIVDDDSVFNSSSLCDFANNSNDVNNDYGNRCNDNTTQPIDYNPSYIATTTETVNDQPINSNNECCKETSSSSSTRNVEDPSAPKISPKKDFRPVFASSSMFSKICI